MNIKLQECGKQLITVVYDWTQWTGDTAKYFETCRQSAKEDVTVLSVSKDITTLYQMGGIDTTTVTGTSCTPGKGALWPWWKTGSYADHLFTNLASYWEGEYGSGEVKII